MGDRLGIPGVAGAEDLGVLPTHETLLVETPAEQKYIDDTPHLFDTMVYVNLNRPPYVLLEFVTNCSMTIK